MALPAQLTVQRDKDERFLVSLQGYDYPGEGRIVERCDLEVLIGRRATEAIIEQLDGSEAEQPFSEIKDGEPAFPTQPEEAARKWLDAVVPATSDEHPSDIGYSADQMVDSFIAGAYAARDLFEALDAAERAHQAMVAANELEARAFEEGWYNDPTGSSHLTSANLKFNALRIEAEEKRRTALSKARGEHHDT